MVKKRRERQKVEDLAVEKIDMKHEIEQPKVMVSIFRLERKKPKAEVGSLQKNFQQAELLLRVKVH